MGLRPLNLFYEERDDDRWIPFDRYPRRLLRRLIRGKPRIGGQGRLFQNLRLGLDALQVPYRLNDFSYARRHPEEVACVVGQCHVVDRLSWKNPILFGAAVFSHPSDDPTLLERVPIRKVLVPGPWMKKMCEPFWNGYVEAWPVGIHTDVWTPTPDSEKSIDLLIYDKLRWSREQFVPQLLTPILAEAGRRGLSTSVLRYGFYNEEDYGALLRNSRGMVFLCEHETQGLAYQQALSAGVPVFAYDEEGFWRDPAYYPHRVQFAPVTSVPYWDERCGLKFKTVAEFRNRLEEFMEGVRTHRFKSRDYILENLTLKKCAQHYVDYVKEVQGL